LIFWAAAVIKGAIPAIPILEDNPAIWNAIAETTNRIFPPLQPIFVSLSPTFDFGDAIHKLPMLTRTKIKLKNGGPCVTDQPLLDAYYWILNGKRLQHPDLNNEKYKMSTAVKFNTSHLEDIILKKIHDVCKRPVLVSPVLYPYVPGLLDKKSFVLLLKVNKNDEEGYDLPESWRQTIYIFRYSTLTFNTGSRVLIVILDMVYSKEKIIKIFKSINTPKININDVYILTQGSNPGTMDLYTWYPHELPSGECGNFKETILLDTWVESDEGGKFVKNLNLSLNKSPIDMHNCCLKLEPFNPIKFGVETEIVKLVSRKMNRDSKTCKSVIFVNTRSQGWRQSLVSVRFFTFDFRFFVPVAESYFSWSSITDVFHVSAWLFVIFSFLAAAFFVKWLAGSSYCVENPGYNEIVRCLMSCWSLLLGMGDSILPINAPMRIFLFSWILYSMCIGTVFQAFFNSYFVVPGHQHQIDSVQELAETNATLLFTSYDTFTRFSPTQSLGKVSYLLFYWDAYKFMMSTPNTALFSNSLEFSYYIKHVCKQQTPRTYHQFTGDEMQVDDDMYVSDPLIRSHFNKLVTQVVEGGIAEKLIKDTFITFGDEANDFQLQKMKDNFFALSFLHLWSVFCVLLLLHMGSLLVFIFELVYHGTKQ
ncbi:Ionotropic receptor 791, partial [Blattella germanica]